MDYTLQGNERLKPLAVAGDLDAVAELARRGNVLTSEGKLQKVYARTKRNYDRNTGELLSEDRIEETVEDGRRVRLTVNGREVAPEIPAP